MAKVAFLGLGVMGYPMAGHLKAKGGHDVTVYNRTAAKSEKWVAQHGGKSAPTPKAAAEGQDFVMCCVGNDNDLREVMVGADGAFHGMAKGALLVDHTTASAEIARELFAEGKKRGFDCIDAPVSGGQAGAENGVLTVMCGGEAAAYARAEPILQAMGRTIVHAGPAGNGQSAKICNNMILGASMIAVCEGFVLAERLGLSVQTLFDICSKSTSQCWAMTGYCPAPGPVPAAPSNRGYAPGFTAANMLKDLRLAQQAAGATASATPLGAAAANLYQMFVDSGAGGLDFSGIMRFINLQQSNR